MAEGHLLEVPAEDGDLVLLEGGHTRLVGAVIDVDMSRQVGLCVIHRHHGVLRPGARGRLREEVGGHETALHTWCAQQWRRIVMGIEEERQGPRSASSAEKKGKSSSSASKSTPSNLESKPMALAPACA
eukprot:CAMPEP_0180662408 /NCGR_PEP_ID=MMETSP1037_2-20121125/59376_1 /TAXON_ID=632150 /ORGANISM="Azadinium spinosum, Strain 3D9" /LENGTH=128 /DNA_ID=CAMNT_0022690069 /DNA_START=94 /DNA_END=482 /DNA_ORIENTATION=-